MLKINTREFLHSNFLLETESAQVLYDQFAAPMPILDYHNHLSPKDIAENRKFKNLTEIWLEGDHYKWRAMRINGVAERYCTGNDPREEKFVKWAETVPYTMRNPLYHWTHLELKNYFGITNLLSRETAREIYNTCSDMLRQDDFSTLGLLKKMNVEVVCTTDDPADDLKYHQAFQSTASKLKMYPTFRPDKAYAVEDPVSFNEYLRLLGSMAGIDTGLSMICCKRYKTELHFLLRSDAARRITVWSMSILTGTLRKWRRHCSGKFSRENLLSRKRSFSSRRQYC